MLDYNVHPQWTIAEAEIFKPKPKIKVSELAAQIRMVTKGPATGLWTNEFTPYLVEPMDTWNLPWVRKIFICFAPQMGKTQFALNCLLYSIVIDPGDAFYLMPDEKVMKRIMNRQIIPMLRATPESNALLGESLHDVSSLKVNFINGMELMAAWATSPAAMASESARYMFYDEPGKYPDFVGKEADPFSLGDVRTNVFPYTSKQVYFSTPKLAGDGFDKLLQHEPDEVRFYNAKCPYCDTLDQMKFRNMHWGDTDDHREVIRKKTARYRCPHCEKDWDDYARDYAISLGRGRWIAKDPVERPSAIAFGPLESWHSPMISLSKPVAAYLRGRQDPTKKQAFINQHKARAFKTTIATETEKQLLKHKTDLPAGICPAWTSALTAGIDVQKVGFWFVVRAWDSELNSHLVDYGYLSTFEDVRSLAYTHFPVEGSNNKMKIWRAGMDTGGGLTETGEWTRTEEIYMFIRDFGDNVIHAVKGASRAQFTRVRPPSSMEKLPHSNKPIPGGLELRLLDTMDLKKLLHWRLTRKEETLDDEGNIVPAEMQRFYLHAQTGIDYAKQFMAEELQEDRNGKQEWKKIRPSNHLLDCEVIAAACADNSWAPSLKMISTIVANRKPKVAKKEPAAGQPAGRPVLNKSAMGRNERPSWLNR